MSRVNERREKRMNEGNNRRTEKKIINLRCYTVVTGEPDVVTSEVSEMWTDKP